MTFENYHNWKISYHDFIWTATSPDGVTMEDTIYSRLQDAIDIVNAREARRHG